MIHVSIDNDFDAWREHARRLICSKTLPEDVIWTPVEQNGLFQEPDPVTEPSRFKVPKAFLQLAEAASCFDEFERWHLLYRLLYRIVFENPHLLEIESDVDVRRARLMEKGVNRDVHKFHAFVRFRRIDFDGEEIYAAWHEPAHFTVKRAAPFFERRFGSMKFSILTPRGCAHWDRQTLRFSDPVAKDQAPAADAVEDFWLTYYRSIFNPFRLNVGVMKKELPVRHWATLPEAVLIPELIRSARAGE